MGQDGVGVNIIRQSVPLNGRVTMVYTETMVVVIPRGRVTMAYTETMVKV